VAALRAGPPIVIVAVVGVPNIAPAGSINTTLNVLVSTAARLMAIAMALLAPSLSAQFNVPLLAT
jgi:hypothetical protein